jgi:PAS domain S-box-containing protein
MSDRPQPGRLIPASSEIPFTLLETLPGEAIHTLVDAIPQFVWVARPDGFVVYQNQRMIEYLAMTHEQAEGTGWLAKVHPDDLPRLWEARQVAFQTGELYEMEHRLQDGASGEYRCFLSRAVPQRNAQGTILYWIGTLTDIEKRKQAEQRLKESEQNWHALAEAVPQLVWMAAPDGKFEYVNQRYLDYPGITFEHRQSDRWAHLQFIHPDDREGARAQWQHCLDTGDIYERAERLRNNQTGEYRWFLIRGVPVRNETGQIVKWFGTDTDIDEQKRIEEALLQSQKRIRCLIDSNIIGIICVEGEEGVVVEANDAWLRMSGYSREEVRSKKLNREKVRPLDQAPLLDRAMQELTAHGQCSPFEIELACKDGSRLPVLVGCVVFQDQPRQVIAFVLDNSARKELEQRKDDFISMASHELRNPLAALMLQTTLLHRQLTRQGVLDRILALSNIESQIKTITRLVEDLLDVSKIQAGRLEYRQESVDLDALLREIASSMQQRYPSHHVLVRGFVGANLIGDYDRLGQVFTNLLSNAIKYSPGAKTVEIDLCSYEDVVTVRVQDHGLGIPCELRDKIFERFYRATNFRQRAISGLGMGLYIVAEIVKHYGGTITVDSEVGEGSIFTITLPRGRGV